jgi:RimJ/RimL family protein N-acetyltransferase
MTTQLLVQVQQTLAKHFRIPVEQITQPGTTLYPNKTRDKLIVLWQVGEQVVVDFNPEQLPQIETLLQKLPPRHRMTVQDIEQICPISEHFTEKLYVLDSQTFHPFTPPTPYTVRQLTSNDQTAFEAFLNECSEEEVEEGDVSIEHLSAFGVFDGDRLGAVASIYKWVGLLDIGVLTDPLYRRRGMGKAAVSACALHHSTGDQAVVYRHDVLNLGSQGIAQGLNFAQYGIIEALEIAE